MSSELWNCSVRLEMVCDSQIRMLTISVVMPTEIPSSKNIHWWVPRSVNTRFTGRTEILQRIESALTQPASSKQQRRFVITGIGGQGKSEICLKIADQVRERYVGRLQGYRMSFSNILQVLGRLLD